MSFKNWLNEKEKWSKDIDVKKGKMSNLLGLKPGEKVEDKFKTGKQLATALMAKVKDQKEVAGMLAFVANVNPEKNIFDDALAYMKEI